MSEQAVVIRERAVPSFAPKSFADAMEFCKLLSQSSFVPKEFRGKPGEILAAVQFGAELNIGPMQALQNIAVINGKPSIYGDLALALVQGSGKLEFIKESDDGRKATCTVKRIGEPEPHTVTFSDEDAKRAQLFGKSGPWTQYPARMRQFRARGFALRDAFADVLKGLITREEAQDYPTSPATEIRVESEVNQETGEVIPETGKGRHDALVRGASVAMGEAEGPEWLKRRYLDPAYKVCQYKDVTPQIYRQLSAELSQFQASPPQDDDISFDKHIVDSFLKDDPRDPEEANQ